MIRHIDINLLAFVVGHASSEPIFEQNPLHEDPLGMRQRFEGVKRDGNTREQQVLFKN